MSSKGHGQGPPAPEAVEALRESGVHRLLRAAARDHLDDRELRSIADEEGLDEQRARDLLLATLEPLGVTLSSIQGLPYWYFPTGRIRQSLHELDVRCAVGGTLAGLLAAEPALSVRMQLMNAIDSCRLDEIQMDIDSARDLLLLERSPRTEPERIVANSFALFRDVASLAERELDVQMMGEIYERLVDGVSGPVWDAARPEPGLRLNALSFETPFEALSAIVGINRRSSADASVHRALLSLNLHANVLAARPFPRLNGTVARLAMHIESIRRGYPVLGSAPFSRAYALWERGAMAEANLPTPALLHRETYTPNITGWVTLWLELAGRALDELEAEAREAQKRRLALLGLLEFDPDLNERQREILAQLLNDPQAALRIMAHKTTYDIAYSTARADFHDLERKGYIVRGRSGRAATYTAADDLAQRLRA